MKRMKRWLLADPVTLSEGEHVKLPRHSRRARRWRRSTRMRQELASLWERSTESSEQLLARLQDWCHRAEASEFRLCASFRCS
jgi:stearoyl-CoA desaturase (delta-9 desaturase)